MKELADLLNSGMCIRLWSGLDIIHNKLVYRADMGRDPSSLVIHVGPRDSGEALFADLAIIASRFREAGNDWKIFDNPNALTI